MTIKKKALILLVLGIIITVRIGFYMFNQPARDIQATKTDISEKTTIVVNDGKISLNSKFNLTLADYEVAFKKGKPFTNIAKTVAVSVEAHY
ncbi:hypothetical protein SAMN05216503_0348 [Polaribacter sp. KT25b]|uniref:hypothetical protein n=1 Tax=Polaribacter sp. KT25b TaxID=1855336 RepID=UPI00087A2B3D|nr:hypothetical protein [Polaribacter sp. KT25b]SDR68002.1 hypothetical protein SAMN05216503_0348 [Polaribacter sp. KT25b]